MTMDNPTCLDRKHPAHMPLVDMGNRARIVFLTVCTQERRPLLAHDDIHALLVEAWRKAQRWQVGRYVVLPDHIHWLCAPVEAMGESIRAWMKFWKTLASRAWPRPEEHPLWQQNGWDTQLRHGDSYAAKWEYVRNNPIRKGLVGTADAWPYQGELTELRW